MAKPVTSEFHQMVVEMETETPGTWTKICGIQSRGITRSNNMNTTEVPADCDDESLPAEIERTVQSSEVTITGSGVWAKQSHEMMLDWWYSGAKQNIRVQHVNADVGDTEFETGMAFLASLSNSVEKGQKVTAEIDIQFDGKPTRTAKAA